MKYEYDMLLIESRAIAKGMAKGMARGMAKGEFKKSLKIAQKMVKTKDFDYLSELLDLPIEYIEEINNGCSIEDMVEKYFVYETND